jgi:putative PLP-dependent aminotransferase (TIGR04422 family)
MFHGGHPVLYSSARSALACALSELNLSRRDTVGIFPYASHCVLDTISRIATPASLSKANNENLVYHQWGYIYSNSTIHSNIEDAVDSLLRLGGHLFPKGGTFEIWSFPKIAGTSGGGVLWCRSKATAHKLRYIRDQKPHRNALWLMRLIGLKSYLFYAMWQGAEAFFGRPSSFLVSEIYTALDNWSTLIDDRQTKLSLAWQFAPSWLTKPVDRFPCVVPIEFSHPSPLSLYDEQPGISSKLRHLVRVLPSGSHLFTPTMPVPIHQDVTIYELQLILEQIFDRR